MRQLLLSAITVASVVMITMDRTIEVTLIFISMIQSLLLTLHKLKAITFGSTASAFQSAQLPVTLLIALLLQKVMLQPVVKIPFTQPRRVVMFVCLTLVAQILHQSKPLHGKGLLALTQTVLLALSCLMCMQRDGLS